MEPYDAAESSSSLLYSSLCTPMWNLHSGWSCNGGITTNSLTKIMSDVSVQTTFENDFDNRKEESFITLESSSERSQALPETQVAQHKGLEVGQGVQHADTSTTKGPRSKRNRCGSKCILARETHEQRERRLEKLRLSARRMREKETSDERAARLEKLRLNTRKYLAQETPEEREKRLAKMRQAAREYRMKETSEQRKTRLEKLKKRAEITRSCRSDEKSKDPYTEHSQVSEGTEV